MKVQLFSIFDKKARTYSAPFTCLQHGEAIRMMQIQLEREPEGMHAKYAEDFELWFLGEFDQSDASFDLEFKPEPVIRFDALVERKQHGREREDVSDSGVGSGG